MGAAELGEALSGEGPFTVFAPTDDAFAALPDGTVETLLLPENKELLQSILLYHVVSGRVLAETAIELAADNTDVETLEGRTIQLSLDDSNLFINQSQVINADVLASNGVIHVINQVLLPPAMPTPAPELDIVDTAVAAGSFNTLVAAVQAAGLVEALKGPGPFTVFAPTDDAFAALPEGTVETLLQPENLETLTNILHLHVAPVDIMSADLKSGMKIETLAGQKLKIKKKGGKIFVNGSKVISADIGTSNGVIHVINHVLLP